MKNQLRKVAIETRKQLDSKNLSMLIINRLFALPEYENSKNILCYYPLKYEVSTLRCFDDLSKKIFLPRVNSDFLEICPYDKNSLKIGSYNIIEPDTVPINSFDNLDMIIIPAVACDVKGYRLGYGKGYYDRFLKNVPTSVLKVILQYSTLVFDTVYPESFDVKSDIIITEKELIRI